MSACAVLHLAYVRGPRFNNQHAQRQRLAARTVKMRNTGSVATCVPSTKRRQKCPATIRPKTVPVVIM